MANGDQFFGLGSPGGLGNALAAPPSAAPPSAPQAPGPIQQDAEAPARAAQWFDGLKRIRDNPEYMMALFQFGLQLTQPRPYGQSEFGHGMQGLNRAMQYLGLQERLKRERGIQEEGLEEKREERQFRRGQEERLTRKQEQDLEMGQRRLGLQEAKLETEKTRQAALTDWKKEDLALRREANTRARDKDELARTKAVYDIVDKIAPLPNPADFPAGEIPAEAIAAAKEGRRRAFERVAASMGVENPYAEPAATFASLPPEVKQQIVSDPQALAEARQRWPDEIDAIEIAAAGSVPALPQAQLPAAGMGAPQGTVGAAAPRQRTRGEYRGRGAPPLPPGTGGGF